MSRIPLEIVFVLVAFVISASMARAAGPRYDELKSSYPQLHELSTESRYEGLKSGYPQLHAALAQRRVPASAPALGSGAGFAWGDALLGVAAGALLTGFVALAGLLLMRIRITAVR